MFQNTVVAQMREYEGMSMQEGSLFSTPSPAFIVYRVFDDGHSKPVSSLIALRQRNLKDLFDN